MFHNDKRVDLSGRPDICKSIYTWLQNFMKQKYTELKKEIDKSIIIIVLNISV